MDFRYCICSENMVFLFPSLFRYSALVSLQLCVCFVPVHLFMPPQREKRERGCVRPGSTSLFIMFFLRHQVELFWAPLVKYSTIFFIPFIFNMNVSNVDCAFLH